MRTERLLLMDEPDFITDRGVALTSSVIRDPRIRRAFARLEKQGILFFNGVSADSEGQLSYLFQYRCKCPDAPWRELSMPEWKVRAEFVL